VGEVELNLGILTLDKVQVYTVRLSLGTVWCSRVPVNVSCHLKLGERFFLQSWKTQS